MLPTVRRIVDYASSNLERPMTLNDLTHLVKLSRSRMCRLFKQETGMSIGCYIKCLRMKTARDLLETTPMSVKEIATRIGMRDQSHFVRDFQKTYGLTPSQYRAKMKKPSGDDFSRDLTHQNE